MMQRLPGDVLKAVISKTVQQMKINNISVGLICLLFVC